MGEATQQPYRQRITMFCSIRQWDKTGRKLETSSPEMKKVLRNTKIQTMTREGFGALVQFLRMVNDTKD
jgi:DNA-binding transcriptional regulator PaaX